MKSLPTLLAAAMLVASPALAAPDEAAFAAYVAGDYEKSAAMALAAAETGARAENAALAARAVNALAYFENGKKETRAHADRALDYADQAIKAEPQLPEGYLQAAIALGLRGAKMAPAKAFLINLPNKVRNYLDAALKIDPDNQWALSTSAAWRLEVARRGGGKAYHADPKVGHAEFQRARALAPDSVVIAYECALRLLASQRPEWRAEGLTALDAAVASAPQNAFDKAVQARALEFKAAVDQSAAAEAAFIAAQP
jgi:hypothetical protein